MTRYNAVNLKGEVKYTVDAGSEAHAGQIVADTLASKYCGAVLPFIASSVAFGYVGVFGNSQEFDLWFVIRPEASV